MGSYSKHYFVISLMKNTIVIFNQTDPSVQEIETQYIFHFSVCDSIFEKDIVLFKIKKKTLSRKNRFVNN